MPADRSVTVRLRADISNFQRNIATASATTGKFGSELDRFSGRLGVLLDTAAILGPTLAPIGAVAVPAVTGLAAQLGAAAVAGGTALLAFQGVGDALEAVNDAALEPTTENLEKARLAMQELAPEARSFVREVQAMRPALDALQESAAGGLFPRLEEALVQSQDAFPRLERVLYAVGDAAGQVADEFAEGITGPRGQEFLRFVQDEVPGALVELGQITGNLTAGLGELWMAFTPLNRSFSHWLLDASESFDDWAQGLAQTQGFEDFVAYIRTTGPKVADALSSIGGALLEIVEAAAPVGGTVLEALRAVADVVSTIADSDAGPAILGTVTALALLRRSMATFNSVSQTAWATNIRGAQTFTGKIAASRGVLLKGGGALAGLAIAASGAADGIGLTNAASGALMGSLGGPWGAAIGGAIGFTLDLADAQHQAAVRAEELAKTLDAQTGAITDATRQNILDTLDTEGILSDAEDLGLRLDTVAAAAMGSKAALSALRTEQRALKTEQQDTTDALGADVYGEDSDKARERAAAIDQVIGAVTGENDALNAATGSARRKIAANKGLEESYGGATTAAEALAGGVLRLNQILSKRASERDYEQSLDDFTKSLKENGHTLDINTEKGRNNQEAMDDIVSTAVQVAQSMNRTNRVEFLKQARKDFVDATAKLLGGRDAAGKLWDRLVQLDKTQAKPDVDVDISDAMQKIGQIQYELQQLDGHHATTYVDTVYTKSGNRFKDVPSGVPHEANGGIITHAEGGIDEHGRPVARTPQLRAAAQGMVMWGEPETGWEAYISGKPGMLHRNQAVWAEAGRRLGMVGSGGRTQVVERVVERLPREFTVTSDIGPLVLRVVDSRVGDYRQHDADGRSNYQGVDVD